MAVSYIHSETAREMLPVRFDQGLDMASALLLYKDNNGDVYWHGSDEMTISEAVLMLEKVKLELIKRS